MSNQTKEHLHRSLAQIVGSRNLVVEKGELEEYSRAVLVINPETPSLVTTTPTTVVRPASTSEVAAVVTLADKNSIPVYVTSGGTELTGGASPAADGILVDMDRMNRVLDINEDAFTVTVEAACTLEVIERRLAIHKLRLGHIPMSIELGVTAAGAASNSGIGVECPGFETIVEQVMGMEAVLSSGDILRVKPVPKSATGHRNLAWLFLGTEGMHGIITELTLRVRPFEPENRRIDIVGFPSFEAAVRASCHLYRKGATASMMFAMNRDRALWCMPELTRFEDVHGVLALEFDGATTEIASALESFATSTLAGIQGRILGRNLANNFRDNMFGNIPSHRVELFSGQTGSATTSFFDCDSVLQWHKDGQRICSEYEVSLLGTAHLGPKYGFTAIIHGTSGSSKEDILRIIRCRYALTKRALELGGCAEASHGVGLHNAYFLEEDLGARGLRLMQELKGVLDPHGILNPGKSWHRPADSADDGGESVRLVPDESV